MAKLEGSRGFELANGRAANRVSEKGGGSGERSPPPGPDCIRAASRVAQPWLRLQRLHKAAILGAAVSAPGEGRRRAGPNRSGLGRAPSVGIPLGACPPLDPPTQAPRLRLSTTPGQDLDEPTPAPPGAGLLPLCGRASLALPAGRSATSSSAALGAGLYPLWAKQVPLAALVGGRPSSPPTGAQALTSAPGRWVTPIPVRLALLERLSPAVIWAGLLVGKRCPPGTASRRLASLAWKGLLVQGPPSWGITTPAPCHNAASRPS